MHVAALSGEVKLMLSVTVLESVLLTVMIEIFIVIICVLLFGFTAAAFIARCTLDSLT